MRMFLDPSYAYNPYGNPFKRRKKKNKPDEMDIFEKFIMFQSWLDSQREKDKAKEPKKDDKKPEPNKKVDTAGLAMFLMVFSFFAGQASLIWLMANMPK